MMIELKFEAEIITQSELTPLEKQLLWDAVVERGMAQAPFSGYLVGAAIKSSSGATFMGCNVERGTYTQTTHAEQNAIDTMVAVEGETSRVLMVVVAAGPRMMQVSMLSKPKWSLPSYAPADIGAMCCGHCLQIIWEQCGGNPDVPILSLLPNGEVLKTTIGVALPLRFTFKKE